jgi:predicted NAD/FAD-binding protein
MRIAIVGTGISGNLIAHLLHDRHDICVFEANAYVGGHSNTVEFEAFGSAWQADTGFMVFNDRTYPHFIDLLERLGVEVQDSDMSFSVHCNRTGLEYQGSSLNGLFAQRRNMLSPRFYRMLIDIVRFNRTSCEALDSGRLDSPLKVGTFLDEHRLGEAFRTHYLVPMVAAIWSADPRKVLEFPAKFLIGFMRNHGLLQLRDRPQWKTIVGGSRRYVERLVAPFRDRIRLSCPVASVTRSEDTVRLRTAHGDEERFDQIVFACHADQTLRILKDATTEERETLQAFPYQANDAVLHTDTSLLPRRRRAWASWNYSLPEQAGEPATVTYDLSRLQRLQTPAPVLLTLNQTEAINPKLIIDRIRYDHPAYSLASVAGQRRFDSINGTRRTYFCGAYWGYGFHEDGVNSALAVANYFDLTLESCTAVSTRDELHTAGMNQ